MTMIPQVAEVHDRLSQQKERFLASLQALTAEQLDFRVKPEAWTVVQVGHHVVQVEQRTADAIKKHRGMRSGKRRLHHRLGNLLLWLVFKTGLRVKNPVPEVAPDADVDLAQLLEAWERARTDLEEVLSEVKERGLQYAAFKHPVGGPLTVEQALDFLVMHLDHHLRQIERIQRHPEFPT
jgi:uncharacterized damage-inducible protein DinB